MAYITTAVNISEGKGVLMTTSFGQPFPLTHFPPSYPAVLAIAKLVTGDVLKGATLTGALLYASNITLIGWIVYLATKRWPLSLAAALVALMSPVILDIHIMAMSEPLFTLCLLSSITLLTMHVIEPRTSMLLLAAILAAAAWLTRYIGVTIIFTGLIMLIVGRRVSWKNKFQEILLYIAVSITPFLVWMVRNTILTGNFANRTFVVHPLTRSNRKKALDTLTGWFEIPKPRLPEEFFNILLIVVVVILIFMMIYAIGIVIAKNRKKVAYAVNTRYALHFFFAFGLYTIIYLSFLLLSITFFDASTRLHDRILYPSYLSILLYFFTWIGVLLDTTKRNIWVSAGLVAILAIILILFSNHSYDLIKESRSKGLGFNSARWMKSETIKALKQLGHVEYTLSTESSPVYYLTAIPSIPVPQKFNPVTGKDLPLEEEQMSAMRLSLSEPDTYLVLFYRSFNRREMFLMDNYIEKLTLISEHEDGAIYILEND
jgi:hypothetical protein